MADLPPRRGKPIFSINAARKDIFRLPVYISLYGLIGMLILILWVIGIMIDKKGFFYGLVFLPFIPLILALLYFMVLPSSKHEYYHIYNDGIESEMIFLKGLENTYYVRYFAPFEYLTITPKNIVGIHCYYFRDYKNNTGDLVAPDIANKLFPHIQEQAGAEKWGEIFQG